MTDEEQAWALRHSASAVTVVRLPTGNFAVLDKQLWFRGTADTPHNLEILINEVVDNPPLAPDERHRRWKAAQPDELDKFLTDLGL